MGAEDAARASAPPPVVTAVVGGATHAPAQAAAGETPGLPNTPANLVSDDGPDEPTYSPLPAAQDSAMSDVRGTMGSDNDLDDESPVYSEEGNDDAGATITDGDQGEQFWRDAD